MTGPHPRVLVVDDDHDCGEELVELLASEGLDAHLATTVAQATDMARVLHPDLAVVDLELGGECGIDLVLAWRTATSPVRKVVLLSGRSLSGAERLRLEPQAPLLLAKPLHIERLLALLPR